MKGFLFGVLPFVHSVPCEDNQSTDGKLSDAAKLCRRKCEWVDDEVVPRFDLWEKYCVYTFSDNYWDEECSAYYHCLLGCDIFKIDGQRMTMSQESVQETLPESLDKELKCEVDQCKSFCVKWKLNTCHEVQFLDFCKKSKETAFYKCLELDCNAGFKFGPNGFLLFALLLFHVDALGFVSFTMIKRLTSRCLCGFCLTFCMITGVWMALYLYSGNPMFGRPEDVEENVWDEYDKKLKKNDVITVDSAVRDDLESSILKARAKPSWKLPGDRWTGRPRKLKLFFFGMFNRDDHGL